MRPRDCGGDDALGLHPPRSIVQIRELVCDLPVNREEFVFALGAGRGKEGPLGLADRGIGELLLQLAQAPVQTPRGRAETSESASSTRAGGRRSVPLQVQKKAKNKAKDLACETRPGGKLLCLRGFGSGY